MTPGIPPDRAAVRYLALIVAYDGREFSGSQRQSNGPSVQGELERALAAVLDCHEAVTMAGRTDAGVHAVGQCCRIVLRHGIPVERIPPALNRELSKAVQVRAAREVPEEWHPRFSARRRVYQYVIDNEPVPNPLLRGLAGHVPGLLSLPLMRAGAALLRGRHDFAAWQSAGSPAHRGTVRTLYRLSVVRRQALPGSRVVLVTAEADAFLYRMVRNLVGALIKVGQGELAPEALRELTAQGDRRLAPPPAPAAGLTLVQVKY